MGILFSFYLFTTSEQIQVERFDKNYKGKYLRLAKSFPLIQKEWRKLRTSIGNNRRKRVKKTTIYVDKEDEGKGKKVATEYLHEADKDVGKISTLAELLVRTK